MLAELASNCWLVLASGNCRRCLFAEKDMVSARQYAEEVEEELRSAEKRLVVRFATTQQPCNINHRGQLCRQHF